MVILQAVVLPTWAAVLLTWAAVLLVVAHQTWVAVHQWAVALQEVDLQAVPHQEVPLPTAARATYSVTLLSSDERSVHHPPWTYETPTDFYFKLLKTNQPSARLPPPPRVADRAVASACVTDAIEN